MGWFDTQLKERHDNDLNGLDSSCRKLSSIINKRLSKNYSKYDDAIDEICAYYELKNDKNSSEDNINERMDSIFKSSGIMRRHITLSGKWYKDLYGVLLCELKEGGIVALIPNITGSYTFYDHEKHIKYKLNSKTAKLINNEAVCFYEPLPQRELSSDDIYKFIFKSISPKDLIMYIIVSVIVILLGMVMPMVTSLLFDAIIPSNENMFIITIGVMLIGVGISKFLFMAMKTGCVSKMEQKMKIRFRNALYARVLTLPTDFFKKYNSGDIANRVNISATLCTLLSQVLFETGVTLIMSLMYFFQVFFLAPPLVLPVLIIIVIRIAISITMLVLSIKNYTAQLSADAKLSGVVFSLFSGIQKIKVTGGEARAYKKWANVYSDKASGMFDKPFILKINTAIEAVIAVLGLILIYSFAYDRVSVSEYVSFNVSYGMIIESLTVLAAALSSIAYIKPVMELISPILNEKPETREDKESVKRISGNITISNISFKYTKDGPNIIDNLNLTINKGQYVAIVGTTGCGKSTLMRIMLGFESPDVGAVYYDNNSLANIDKSSFRKHIGVVLQNGKLMADDIFSNIAISAPGLTISEAWEAAEIAGVADDIRNMPMGMGTVICEGGGGISGGQRQRLLIARAIAHKPSILMLDEATSALDNLTQKKISDSLDKMDCTRIVIAHRLSTIRQCDRIVVLDKGKIAEDGKYDELIAKKGIFAELVERQRLDAENEE